MDFNLALQFVLDHEGGYVNHPADPGGETNMGITRRTAQAHGYRGPMRGLSMTWVRRIYRAGYWDACRCEELPEHPLRLAVFDAAVHSGPVQAQRWLLKSIQEVLGENANRDALSGAHPLVLDNVAQHVIDRRLAFLKGLATWPTFGKGWKRRLADLREAIA